MAESSLIEPETGWGAGKHGYRLAYLTLIALAGPFREVVLGRAQPIWLSALALAAFVACFALVVETAESFLVGPTRPVSPALRRLHPVFVTALAPIAVAASLAFGTSWLALFLYVVVTATLTVPLSWAPRSIVAAALAVIAVELVRQEAAGLATAAGWALSVGMAGYAALLLRRRGLLVRELRAAQDEIARLAAAHAVSAERLRFARDLHDLLGHSLSVIALKAELARRLLERELPDSRAEDEVGDVEVIARRALGEVRQAVSGYREASLAGEVDRARVALEAAGVEVEVQGSLLKLPADSGDLLAWVMREATTNVVRHSQAHHVKIVVHELPEGVTLEVGDDGVGIEGEVGDKSKSVTYGSGLTGLAERLRKAGGRLEARPQADGGFHVKAFVPTAPRHAPATPEASPAEPAAVR